MKQEPQIDWITTGESLSESGYALTGPLLAPAECAALTALYTDDRNFRSKVVMERFRFGKGDYKYFRYPLPPVIEKLRAATYPHLANIANDWSSTLGRPAPEFPAKLETFLEKCHRAGQKQPT